MLLSIGMIVKNEEKYLRRCLDAMKPILEQLDSELIIADTGSTDNTVAIAKEFTDNVFYFEWCNDFSAARNSTLKKAKGEWFMAVDGDEIIQDASPLIEFFNSGEYKKYNGATFVQRNYRDITLNNSTDFDAGRLVKITKETSYKFEIHEQITNFVPPIKTLSVIFDHYGYITEDVELVKQKSKRNLDILFSQLKNNPNDCFCLFNLCTTYQFMDDPNNALKYCIQGLKYAEKEDKILKYSLYICKAKIYYKQGKIVDTLNTIEDYFNSKAQKTDVIATDIEMFYLKAGCNYMLSNYEESIVYYKKYLEILSEYRQGLHRTIDSLHHPIGYTKDSSFQLAVMNLINCYMKKSDYDTAVKETTLIFLKLSKKHPYSEDPIFELENYSNIPALYENTEEKYRDLFQNILEKAIENENCKSRILKAFASVVQPHTTYTELMKLRHEYDNLSITQEAVSTFFENAETWEPLYADAVYFAICLKVPLQTVALKFDAYNLNANLFNSPYLHFKDLPDVIYSIYEQNKVTSETFDANINLWMASLYRTALVSNKLKDEQAETLFFAYAKTNYAYITSVFKEEILSEEDARYIPKPFRVGFYCYLAVDSLDKGSTSQYIKHLKTALSLDQELKDIVSLLRDKIQTQLDNNQTKDSQFDQYAKMVKATISSFITKGETDNALKILSSYIDLCPDDPEIITFKTQLNMA